jgi:hypothetical protein
MSALTSSRFCIVRFDKAVSKWLPRYVPVLHDSSVDAWVSKGEGCVVEDGLTIQQAQTRAAVLNNGRV